MKFEDLSYDQFLEDIPEDFVSLEEIPASFGQLQFITNMFENGMADKLPEHEYKQVTTWLNSGLSFKDAGILIDRILDCQPDEPPRGEKKLAEWIKRRKLFECEVA